MAQPTQKKKLGWFPTLILIVVVIYIADKLGCNKDSEDKKDNQTEVVKKNAPAMTEEEYLKYFQDKWDSVKLEKEGKIPQYETYQTNLENILQEMVSVLGKDTSSRLDSPSKLNKLRLKLINSKKNQTAISNYLTYGQPLMADELKDACESYLKENANDPSSIDVDGYVIQGQSKRGWTVTVKYRGKNAFGGLVLNISTCDVRFNPSEKVYYVASAY